LTPSPLAQPRVSSSLASISATACANFGLSAKRSFFLSRSLALLRQQAVRFSSEFFLPSPLSSELGIRFVQPLVFCGRVGPWIGHPF
jgi:hypothetical protein